MRTRTRPNVEIDTRARRLEHTALAGTNFNVSRAHRDCRYGRDTAIPV